MRKHYGNKGKLFHTKAKIGRVFVASLFTPWLHHWIKVTFSQL